MFEGKGREIKGMDLMTLIELMGLFFRFMGH